MNVLVEQTYWPGSFKMKNRKLQKLKTRAGEVWRKSGD